MAKGEKISRALGSLSEGLVRQADIGGVMYKEAATKEAARKAGELKQQERMWDLQIKIAGQTDRDYETVFNEVVKAEADPSNTITDAEGNETIAIPDLLRERLEKAEIRRNEAYAVLGAIAPGGGGGKIQYAFKAHSLDIISRNKSAVEDWKEMIAKGKTPLEFDTEIDRVLKDNYPDLVGNKEARSQFAEQLREALAAPSKPTSVIGMTDEELDPGLISQASQGTQRFNPREGSRRETATTPGVAQRVPGTAGEFEGRTTPGPRGIGGRSVKEDAEVAEEEAMQRYVSQLSPAGQQYWQQYLEETKTTKRADVIESLQEIFNQLSDSDRKLITQVQSAMRI
tara:strand:+ start:1176 stop:2201 length:1026 start_codon:yes stop_codon:yes gene_type:complete